MNLLTSPYSSPEHLLCEALSSSPALPLFTCLSREEPRQCEERRESLFPKIAMWNKTFYPIRDPCLLPMSSRSAVLLSKRGVLPKFFVTLKMIQPWTSARRANAETLKPQVKLLVKIWIHTRCLGKPSTRVTTFFLVVCIFSSSAACCRNRKYS